MPEAKELAKEHAGTLVVKPEVHPAVGKVGDPTVLFQTGRIGDFD